jgi:gamma-tubulin complex component 4
MLPEYIHMRVAESILFAGKAIRVLRNPSPGATLQEPFNQSQNSKGSHRMQSFIGGSGVPKELPNFSNISAEELLPQAEADKIDAMLKELKVSSWQILYYHGFVLCTFPCFAAFDILIYLYLIKGQY